MILFNTYGRHALSAAFTVFVVTAANLASAASSYSETYEDRVVNCTELQTGKFTLKMVEAFSGDTSSFDPFTTVTIQVGDVSFSALLGTDCKFRQGATKARLQQIVSLPSGGGALALDVQLSWAGGVLTATVRGFPPISGSPIGDDLYNSATIGAVSGTVVSSVQFISPTANITVSSTTPVAGTATEKLKGACSTQFNLRRVKVAGSAQ
ncbi:MAG: hypothetical protein ACR2IE_18645 [Candidatus Sumerlaeaceae bacterium]